MAKYIYPTIITLSQTKKISKTLRDYDYDSRSWKILKTSN